MKKFIVTSIMALAIPGIALAEHPYLDVHSGYVRPYNPPAPVRPVRDSRSEGSNPWPFIAGAIIGGIVVNEINRDRDDREYRPYPPRQRYITVCENIPLYDVYGYYVRTERRCHQELVPAY